MSQPEIRLQAAAIALSEELNFTRAAERVRVTQPAFSKQIAELERFIGFHIVVRGQTGVELTPAGEIFVRACKDAQALVERAVRQGRAENDRIQSILTVGHSPYADPSWTSILLGIRLPLYPELRVRMESMFAQDLSHGLLSGELDLAIIPDPTPSPQLTLVPITTAPLYAAIPMDHPASQRSSVTFNDFTNMGWVVFPRKAHPPLYDRLFKEAQSVSVHPNEIHHYLAPEEASQLITENFSIAFMSKASASLLRNHDIAIRPLAVSSLEVTTYLALKADQNSKLVNDFGRAFLRKVQPLHEHHGKGQLLLGL